MSVLSNYVLQKKRWEDLSLSLRMYGENEPPEMQLENMYELVSRTNGTKIEEPIFDQSDFSHSDRMYPSMMKPETKSRWDRQKRTYEQQLEQFGKIKRLAHANFMSENPEHPLTQGLAKTSYGQKVYSELEQHMRQQCQQSSTPQSGTGQSIRDEMQRDSVDLHGAKNQLVKFTSPETNEVFAALATERDETGRIVDKTFGSTESQHELTYEYDSEGRLNATYYSGKAVEAYAYNNLGQRIQSHVSAGNITDYTYNQMGQLIQTGTTTYRYNEDGDLIEKNDSGQLTRYNYLTTGQLCEIILPNGSIIRYRFDENGLRSEKLINDQLYQRYHWADLTTLAAVEDSSGTTRFQYNENGDPVAMQKNDDVYLLATDQLGSVFAVADLTGNSLQEILYDSFGRMIQSSNPDHDLYLGFAAGLHDKDTGLIHFGYREYDPAIGKFIAPDPLGLAGGDVDVYGYCLDDPINFYDRTGLTGESEETSIDKDKHEQIQRDDAFVRGDSSDTPSHRVHEKEDGFPSRVGNGLVKTVKGTGRALGEIGRLAGEAGAEIARETLDATLKKISPITHPETKKFAQEFVRKRIKGESHSSDIIGKAAKLIKKGLNNMTDKEKKRIESLNESAAKINSNSTRGEKIKAVIEPSLKEWAKVPLSTPDPVVTPRIKYLEKIDQIRRQKTD